MKSKWIVMIAVISIVLVSSTAFAAKTTVDYWSPVGRANPHGIGLLKMIDKFHETHPDIQINRLEVPTELEAKVLTAIAGGTPPDAIYFDRFRVAQYAARGAFMSLDDFIEKAGMKPEELFWNYAWLECLYKGKAYAFPHQVDVRALLYNVDHFKEVGLDPDEPPKNWDDLEEYTKTLNIIEDGKLKRVGFAPTLGNWFFYGWLWANGGMLLSDTMDKPAFNSPEGLEALTYIVDFTDEILGGYEALDRFMQTWQAGVYEGAGSPIFTGQIAMQIEGDWMIGMRDMYAPDMNFRFADIPVNGDNPPTSWMGGWSMVIPRGAKKADAAFEFLKYANTDPEGQLIFSLNSGRIPALAAPASDSAFLEKFKGMDAFVKIAQVARTRPATPVGSEMWDIVNTQMVDKAVRHAMPPKEALDWAAAELQKALDEFLSK